MPKLLHLPLTVPGSEQVGQEHGFREVFGNDNYFQFDFIPYCAEHGNEATNTEFKRLVTELSPDILWMQLQETAIITPETIEVIHRTYPQVWITTWSGDARDYLPSYLTRVLPFCDIFYNDTDQVEMYKPYCKRYEFMPIAVDPDEVTKSYDIPHHVPEIIFIGNNYGETFSNGAFRLELMRALSLEFGDRFGVYGNGWDPGYVNALGPIPLKQQGEYYRRAKVVISVDHIKGLLHWSERLIWALANAPYVLVQQQPGIKQHFGKLPYYFTDIPTAITSLHRLLDDNGILHPEMRDFILTKHTWKQRAETVLIDWQERNNP